MTPDQRAKYEQLRHQYWQKKAMQRKAEILKATLGVTEDSIIFFDDTESNRLSELFRRRIDQCPEIELCNRYEAMRAVRNELRNMSGMCIFVGASSTGSVGSTGVPFESVYSKLEELTRRTGDTLSLMSEDGRFGLSLCTQEGDDDDPYYFWVYRDE